jgi:FkbM family methyltransferase
MIKNYFNNLQAVFQALQDEESKRIFIYRLRFALEKCFISPLEHPAIPLPDEKHLKANVIEFLTCASEYFDAEINSRPSNKRPLTALHRLIKNYDGKSRVIIYGAGNFGKCTKDFLEAVGIKTSAFCDSQKYGSDFCGIAVISPADLRADDYIVIAIGATSARTEIYDNLVKNGFSWTRISMCYATFSQYFDYPFLEQKDNETYIDAGCCDGTTILDYAKFSNRRYKKIIGLEADQNNYDKTINLISAEKIRDTAILQKGAWSKTTYLNFTGTGNETAKITDVPPDLMGGGGDVSAVKLDDELAGEYGNLFIKMDIEGSEIEALKGTAYTIRTKKPRLAVSVYHKPEDIIEIPLFLHELLPEYKFYLRHDCLVNLTETILYAIL